MTKSHILDKRNIGSHNQKQNVGTSAFSIWRSMEGMYTANKKQNNDAHLPHEKKSWYKTRIQRDERPSNESTSAVPSRPHDLHTGTGSVRLFIPIDVRRIVNGNQHPGHDFFRVLVDVFPLSLHFTLHTPLPIVNPQNVVSGPGNGD